MHEDASAPGDTRRAVHPLSHSHRQTKDLVLRSQRARRSVWQAIRTEDRAVKGREPARHAHGPGCAVAAAQIFPNSSRMTTIKSTSPMPPLGP